MSHAFFETLYGVTESQRSSRSLLQGNYSSESFWMDWGLWDDRNDIDLYTACENLAILLGNAAQLNSNDTVLDVGFGAGDELFIWIKHFKIDKLSGVEIVPSQVQLAKERIRALALPFEVSLSQGSATNLPFAQSAFNKVLALDCAYHFNSRKGFFEEAYRVLQNDSTFTMIDGVFDIPNNSWFNKLLRFVVGNSFGIPESNFASISEIQNQLRSIGFDLKQCEELTNRMVPGFVRYCTRQSKSNS
jgi:ubiquinone/menaquinone biosynthesis C-methylase UbiE